MMTYDIEDDVAQKDKGKDKNIKEDDDVTKIQT